MNRTVIQVEGPAQRSRIGQLKATGGRRYALRFSTMLQIAAAFQWLESKIGQFLGIGKLGTFSRFA
jgi:hypothetical protein